MSAPNPYNPEGYSPYPTEQAMPAPAQQYYVPQYVPIAGIILGTLWLIGIVLSLIFFATIFSFAVGS